MSAPVAASSSNVWSMEVQIKHYPEPLASHEEIIKDSAIFWDTLRRFHFLMNTKFMIPVIGGKELDLHVLYSEVTRKGGHEKVVAEKKWREVGNVFNFSPTTTSASFVLRKHYFSLLHHYEQVHFFQRQGPLSTPPASFAFGEPSCKNELALVEFTPGTLSDCPAVHTQVTGIIDGKFDCGYLVTVKVGSDIFKGALYHPDQPDSRTSFLQSSNALVPYNDTSRPTSRRRRRKRRKGDPNYPKPNRSGYNFFFAEKHYKLKSLFPNREREFTKMIGESWSNLSPEERMVYQNIGVKDKERYKRELTEYRERMRPDKLDLGH